ncbi:MAG: isoleucine--tRNA ligase [bacterium]
MELKDTLTLPKTSFPQRGNLAKREPEQLKHWDEVGIYDQIIAASADRPRFVLHDGPPYANGSIHYGHILNKVLKDIVVKHRTMDGFRCHYIPGWDCHGLPIELQVDRDLGEEKAGLTKVEVRQKCREYALRFVDIQRTEFQRLGCFGAWDAPYLTLQPTYEAAIVRELGRLIAGGYLYRGRKPVYWCASCRTALAEAEVEYGDHVSPSIYVKMTLVQDAGYLAPELAGRQTSLVIWTTTPWTIPANLAVVVQPRYKYVALEVAGEFLIVAEELAAPFLEACGLEASSRVSIDPKLLEGRKYRHPLVSERKDADYRVWFADHVTLDSGTGLVHTAPGHGAEDYGVGVEHGLDIYAPVDDAGCFTEDVPAYQGTLVHKANPAVQKDLREAGALLNPDQTLSHSYPHCWRCKEPIVFRATPQWFVALDHRDLRQRALDEIDRTTWIPHWGRERIHGMVANRPDWCLSRQRAWGVPLPILYCEQCDEPLVSEALASHAAELFGAEGSDAWFARPVAELAPAGAACGKCGAKSFRKEEDIVDVWFESGVSWAAVCENNPDLGIPVDLYLEGSDQHRGWFHSALLTGVSGRGRAPYKAVLTHGFVVDEHGKPYSKSLRNYEPPDKILSRQGAEIFRLWVASEDYRNDIRISPEIIKRLTEGYRRIRNTARFMLGNLQDFDPTRDAAPDAFTEVDRYALGRLQRLIARVRQAYEEYEFHKVFHALLEYAAVGLSALYLDILKDRLYCDAPQGESRRAAQTVMYEILRAYTALMAPVLVFTAEEVWGHVPKRQDDPESVHLARLPRSDEGLIDGALAERFETLLAARAAVTHELEAFRAAKHHPLDAAVTLGVPAALLADLQASAGQLHDYFIVSSVELVPAAGDDFEVTVTEHAGAKCPRGWKRTDAPERVGEFEGVCPRCAAVLKELGL